VYLEQNPLRLACHLLALAVFPRCRLGARVSSYGVGSSPQIALDGGKVLWIDHTSSEVLLQITHFIEREISLDWIADFAHQGLDELGGFCSGFSAQLNYLSLHLTLSCLEFSLGSARQAGQAA